MWVVAVIAGVLVVMTGWLPWHDVVALTDRTTPVLAFLVGITVVAELADQAQVFQRAARHAARLGRGNARRLFWWIALLGSLTTIVLSLDTTAVLLTPVVLTMAQDADIDPLPFALLAVWLANTASLLLPVSNLTNLLAVRTLGYSPEEFARRMALPELVAVLGTAILLSFAYRRRLRILYVTQPAPAIEDRTLFGVASFVCLAFIPLFILGIPVEWPALGGAVTLVGAFAWRRRSALRISLIPWRTVLLVAGLFLLVQAASKHFLGQWLGDASGHSGSPLGTLRTVGVGAVASNALNNLPTYLAVEPAAMATHRQLLGLLLGTNIGPLITVWGSLATLLWRQRCKARNVHIGARQFGLIGLVGAIPLLLATWATLLLST